MEKGENRIEKEQKGGMEWKELRENKIKNEYTNRTRMEEVVTVQNSIRGLIWGQEKH
jgi:hypothetical protein